MKTEDGDQILFFCAVFLCVPIHKIVSVSQGILFYLDSIVVGLPGVLVVAFDVKVTRSNFSLRMVRPDQVQQFRRAPRTWPGCPICVCSEVVWGGPRANARLVVDVGGGIDLLRGLATARAQAALILQVKARPLTFVGGAPSWFAVLVRVFADSLLERRQVPGTGEDVLLLDVVLSQRQVLVTF